MCTRRVIEGERSAVTRKAGLERGEQDAARRAGHPACRNQTHPRAAAVQPVRTPPGAMRSGRVVEEAEGCERLILAGTYSR